MLVPTLGLTVAFVQVYQLVRSGICVLYRVGDLAIGLKAQYTTCILGRKDLLL
jgi:hypothetical protein